MRSPAKTVGTLLLLVASALTAQASGAPTETAERSADRDEHKAVALLPPMSASSEALPRQELVVSGESWVANTSTNPRGTFSLVGNASDPVTAPHAIHVYLGDINPQVLKPREVVSWTCDALGSGASLKVKNDVGDIIYATKLVCGDALYLNSVTPQ